MIRNSKQAEPYASLIEKIFGIHGVDIRYISNCDMMEMAENN